MKFEWDGDKNKINIKKHKISFEYAAYVFADIEAITIFDEMHSFDEERWITIGRVKKLNIIVVVHTERFKDKNRFIRIISARKANKDEDKLYFDSLNEHRS